MPVAIGVVAIVAVVGGALGLAQQGTLAGSAVPGASPPATRLAFVVRTTLVASQPVSGQVTSSATWTIGAPGGSTTDEVLAAADAVAAAKAQVATALVALTGAMQTRSLVEARDDAAVAHAPAGAARTEASRARRLDRIEQDRGVSLARAAVVHAPAGAARTEAIRARRLDRIEEDQSVSLARAAVAEARRALAAAERELVARQRTEAAGGGTLTWLAPAGSRVARGQAVYAVDGRPAVLLIGVIPPWRALREGDDGPDVAQLEANLVALGFGGSAVIRTDGTFDGGVAQAVRRWQSALGLERSGIVRLGDVVVLPAEVRVTAAHVAVGGAAQPGAPMLDVASSDQVVDVSLDPGLAPSVHVGDAIRFRTEDGTEIPGSVSSVGAPAASTGNGPNGQAGQLVVEVVAKADDPAALAGLDGLTLTADVTTGTAQDALAVPVAALVVLGDGSFGVEVAAAGSTRFVRVTPGIYDRTMVQVQGDGIAEGDQVVIPGT